MPYAGEHESAGEDWVSMGTFFLIQNFIKKISLSKFPVCWMMMININLFCWLVDMQLFAVQEQKSKEFGGNLR